MNVRVIACCVWAEQKVLPPDLYLSWKGRNWKVKEIMSESLLLIAVTDYFTYTFLLLGTNVLCHLFSLSVSLCCACFFIPSSVFFFSGNRLQWTFFVFETYLHREVLLPVRRIPESISSRRRKKSRGEICVSICTLLFCIIKRKSLRISS